MIDLLFERPQYSISQEEKERLLCSELVRLLNHHVSRCAEFKRLKEVMGWEIESVKSISRLPYIPVGLFKSHRLMSMPDEEVFKILTSSGTTGQSVSQIFLDKETASLQTKALARIMTHVLGPHRLPMLIVDTKSVLKDRKQFSARGAGILGMMNFGRDHFYALNDSMELDIQGVSYFIEKHKDREILIFGFTYMVWKYLYEPAKKYGFDLSKAILVHSGGWKKLQDESVTNNKFRNTLKLIFGLSKVYNFYGMVEQVGSIFLEGDDGYLYPPNFSDVIIRDPVSWEEAKIGKAGVIQVLSILPRSYPGNSILTEDLGGLHGIDDSQCGRKGKRFSVIGRIPKSELRGCSDTHAYSLERR